MCIEFNYSLQCLLPKKKKKKSLEMITPFASTCYIFEFNLVTKTIHLKYFQIGVQVTTFKPHHPLRFR